MLNRRDIQAVIFIGALGILLMFSMSYTSQKHIRDLQDTLIVSNDNPTWVSSSLSLEHHNLVKSLALYVTGSRQITKDTVRSSLNSYKSRYELLETRYTEKIETPTKPNGTVLPPDTHSATLSLTVKNLRNNGMPTLARAESLLATLQPGDYSTFFSIHDELETLADDVVLFQINAFEHDRYLDRVQVTLSRKLNNRLWYAYLSIGLGIALGSLVLIMFIWQKLKAAQQLENINTQLLMEATESARLTSELEYRATHDSLSGLKNRFGFSQAFAQALSTGTGTHGLCFIDLDMFKIVNDTSGHIAGDALIQRVAELLTENLPNSAIFGRLGGDEFLVFLQNCDRTNFEKTITYCFDQMHPLRFSFGGKHFDITGSFGAVYFDSSEHNLQSLMEIVDSACYEAKRSGGARVQFYTGEDYYIQTRRSELGLVGKIQHALNHDMFSLYYQPVTPLKGSASDTSWEILLRMIEIDGQPLTPNIFLDVAERYGLAAKIDRWVIEHVFQWLDENTAMMENLNCININLSGRSVGDPDFLGYIEQMTLKLPVDTWRICFEITETSAVGENALGFLLRLKELGYQLALDDFGSGFSSFGYLESLPVDYIKIDGLFVRDMESNKAHHEFVKAIHTVGKAMGKTTVAEYVENQRTLDMLRSLGVDYAQGYHIAKPKALPRTTRSKHSQLLPA
ncbi:MAG: EAL domain-containing protein [Granulosicoccus sp.]